MRTIRLQSIGWVDAKPARELKLNDVIIWNFGYTSTVKSIEPKEKTIRTVIISEDGKEYKRDFRPSRLVAIRTGVIS